MIFNPSKISDVKLKPINQSNWQLGILNLEPDENDNDPFPAQNYEALNAFNDQTYTINCEAVNKIECDKKVNYKVKANPTIFRKAGIDGDKNINSKESG